jgi:putative DNA primase/helicase
MTTDHDRIRETLSFIPADCDRDLWVRMGMAIKSELGEAGFDPWDAWCIGILAEERARRDVAQLIARVSRDGDRR